MKHFFLATFLLIELLCWDSAFAVHSNHAIVDYKSSVVNQQMTVSDFLSINFKNYRPEDGSKLKWGQRVAMKLFQKKIAKEVRKGKIEGTSPFFDYATGEGYSNRTGRMSLIFSSVGLLMLFIPYLAIVGFALGIAGFVLGIIGLKKDIDPTMALIGTILGGLALVLFLFVVIAGEVFS